MKLMNGSDSTPLIVPMTEFDVCMKLTAMWHIFREEHRLREMWQEEGLLSDEAFLQRAKFLRILKEQHDSRS